MTPRIKQPNSDTDLGWFSDALLGQLKHNKLSYDLSSHGPIFDLIHPALIKAQHTYIHSPQELELRSSSSGWNLISYKDKSSAEIHSSVPAYGGFPWHISKFLKDSPSSALIHFDQLGSIYLSRSDLAKSPPAHLDFYHHALPIWLDYALSPELWGPDGKWTRFHTSLHTLFEKYGLLIEQDFPGFYPLNPKANYLANMGFKGSISEKNFTLTFPWDFPLTGLKELEEVMRRGP